MGITRGLFIVLTFHPLHHLLDDCVGDCPSGKLVRSRLVGPGHVFSRRMRTISLRFTEKLLPVSPDPSQSNRKLDVPGVYFQRPLKRLANRDLPLVVGLQGTHEQLAVEGESQHTPRPRVLTPFPRIFFFVRSKKLSGLGLGLGEVLPLRRPSDLSQFQQDLRQAPP